MARRAGDPAGDRPRRRGDRGAFCRGRRDAWPAASSRFRLEARRGRLARDPRWAGNRRAGPHQAERFPVGASGLRRAGQRLH